MPVGRVITHIRAHELEHVVVLVLLSVVLLQATQLTEKQDSVGDPVVIVPPADAFTVYAGQEVNFPWLVVNKRDEPLRVESVVSLSWNRPLKHDDTGPVRSLTALITKSDYASISSLNPGDHKQFRYAFNAPNKPGEYVITIQVKSGEDAVLRDVAMSVVEPR